ncbi:MAG: hypothetical protein ACJ76D_03035 [Solirubrobacterales bacterium]
MASGNERWLTGGQYPRIYRPAWWYAIAFGVLGVGLVFLGADHLIGALGFVPLAVGGVDVTMRAQRLRDQAFTRLESQVPTMSTAQVDEELSFIVRYYGGVGFRSVRQRMAQIRALATGRPA